MKTFETEKNNIPEGATHYSNESDTMYFSWFKGVDTDEFKVMSTDTKGKWVRGSQYQYKDDGVTIIPQISIETPEEKEALDLIDTTSQQYESVASKEVEWKNGDRCIYDGSEYTFVGLTPAFNDTSCILFDTKNGIEHVCVRKLSKPETPQQREEREREELADLACENLFGESIRNCRKDVADTVRCMIEAGYRKEG